MASEREGLAGLKVLVAVAKADGKLAPEEITALESAVQDGGASIDVKALTESDIDLDAVLKDVTDPETRRQIYIAAAAMAHADKEVAPEEDAVLARVQKAWSISDNDAVEAKRLAGIFNTPRAEAYAPTNVAAVPVADQLNATRKATYLASVLAMAFGSVPFPIVPDVAVLVVQGSLVRKIAAIHGNVLSNKEFWALQGGLAGLAATRVAVSSLMKLVPVWGSVFGGSTAFITTWALGVSTQRTLAKGGSLTDVKALKQELEVAKEEGKAYYKENKAEIEKDAKARAEKAKALSADLKDGKITQEEFDKKTAELAD